MKIFADKVILYENCGIYVYAKNQLVFHVKTRNFDIKDVDGCHIYVTWGDININTMLRPGAYIVYKKWPPRPEDDKEKSLSPEITIGTKVIRKDNCIKDTENKAYSDAEFFLDVLKQ